MEIIQEKRGTKVENIALYADLILCVSIKDCLK